MSRLPVCLTLAAALAVEGWGCCVKTTGELGDAGVTGDSSSGGGATGDSSSGASTATSPGSGGGTTSASSGSGGGTTSASSDSGGGTTSASSGSGGGTTSAGGSSGTGGSGGCGNYPVGVPCGDGGPCGAGQVCFQEPHCNTCPGGGCIAFSYECVTPTCPLACEQFEELDGTCQGGCDFDVDAGTVECDWLC